MPQVLTFTVGQTTDAQLRTETLAGREYTVVPVIAIVEGVLQGANSNSPEFAPAVEFGKYPDSWNGRPVVLRHPQIQGIFVSANHPQVYEDWSMGFMFNTKLDGKKLKTEAWIDNARVADMGGEFQETLDKLQAGEVINVSVGVFIDTRVAPGTYNGRQYEGRWENVVPDHLALLPDQVGACSVADGCGTNRVAQALATRLTQLAVLSEHQEIRIVEPVHCCDGCAKGEGCMATPSTNQQTPETQPGESPGPVEPQPAPAPEPVQPPQQQPGHGEPASEPDIPLAATSGESDAEGEEGEGEGNAEDESTPEVLAAQAQVGQHRLEALQGLVTNALGSTVELTDAMRIVRGALPARLAVDPWNVDLLAMTTDVAVFMAWGEPSLPGLYQIRYSVTDQGAVSFTGDPEPVNLMTKIMPRQTEVSANSGNSNEDGEMAENNATPQVPSGEGASEGSPPAQQAPVVNTAPATVDEFLAQAPGPIGNVLKQGIAALERQKTRLIGVIKANSRNKFSDDQLQAMELEQLENLAALAAPDSIESPSSFEGRFLGEQDSLSVQQGRSNGVSPFMATDENYLMNTPDAGNA